jgi:hypothetical protein
VFEERQLPKKLQSSKNGQLESGKAKGENIIFIRPEDEILLKLSSWSFTFAAKADASASYEVCIFLLLHVWPWFVLKS